MVVVVVVVMVVVGHNTMVRYRLSIDLSPRFWTILICRAVDVDVRFTVGVDDVGDDFEGLDAGFAGTAED